jgi:hypothetical protein
LPKDPPAEALREHGADHHDGETRDDERAQQHAHRVVDVGERVEEVQGCVGGRQRRAEGKLAGAPDLDELIPDPLLRNQRLQLWRNDAGGQGE